MPKYRNDFWAYIISMCLERIMTSHCTNTNIDIVIIRFWTTLETFYPHHLHFFGLNWFHILKFFNLCTKWVEGDEVSTFLWLWTCCEENGCCQGKKGEEANL